MNVIDLSGFCVTEIIYPITINLEKGLIRPIRNRQRMGLVFCPDGRVVYNQNGRNYVSDPSHVLLLPTGGTYTLTCEKECSCPMIDFKISPPLESPEIHSFNVTNLKNLLNIFDNIDNLWTFKKPSYMLKCMAGLYEILAALNDAAPGRYRPNYKYGQIQPSIDYLEANYGDPGITNELLAAKSGVSTVYFRKLFTEKHGLPPMRYLHLKRIEKARDMLQSEFHSITGISEAMGFNSIYNFSRAFRNTMGRSPTEYLRECAARNQSQVPPGGNGKAE